jgi:hypothetical protein
MKKARKYLFQSLKLKEKIYGKNHIQYFISLEKYALYIS